MLRINLINLLTVKFKYYKINYIIEYEIFNKIKGF